MCVEQAIVNEPAPGWPWVGVGKGPRDPVAAVLGGIEGEGEAILELAGLKGIDQDETSGEVLRCSRKRKAASLLSLKYYLRYLDGYISGVCWTGGSIPMKQGPLTMSSLLVLLTKTTTPTPGRGRTQGSCLMFSPLSIPNVWPQRMMPSVQCS